MVSMKQEVPQDEKRQLSSVSNNGNEISLTPEGLLTPESHYRGLFDRVPIGLYIFTPDWQITDANPALVQMLGYPDRESLCSLRLEDIYADLEVLKKWQSELEREGVLPLYKARYRRRDGSLIWIENSGRVVKNPDRNHRVFYEGCVQNITARVQDEEERARLLESCRVAHSEADTANNIKDDFLAILSHELRTPLTAILGWSNLLTAGNLNKQQAKSGLETIVRSARAQKQLIDDLLDNARIITGKLRLNMQPVELAPIIETVIDSVRPTADARNIQLQIAVDPHANPISGDSDRLQQIMWNLLTNAIKFTPIGGRVQVGHERHESTVELTISDTGQGIAPEFLPNIFDRFRQSDSSSTRTQGGLGLGLSIVRQLVEMHGGTVMVDSLGVGEGTTVRVVFPVMLVHQEQTEVEMKRPLAEPFPLTDGQPALHALRVLIVDDEPDARNLINVLLTVSGAEVVTVSSAVDALAELDRQRFDVLVSDIGMPEIDGYTLISKIRQLPKERGGEIPAAALTAYAGVEDQMRVLSAGFQTHIAKPVEPAELRAVVANLARRYDKPVVCRTS